MDSHKDDFEACTSHSDLEDTPLTGDQGEFPPRMHRACKRQGQSNNSLLWKWWSLMMTICSLVLLGGIVYSNLASQKICKCPGPATPKSSYPSEAETWRRESLVETQYYRDVRYMTLDKSADYLWQDHVHMSTGNIRLPDRNGSTSLKSISM